MVNHIKVCYSSTDVWMGQTIRKRDRMTVASVSFCLGGLLFLSKWLSLFPYVEHKETHKHTSKNSIGTDKQGQ